VVLKRYKFTLFFKIKSEFLAMNLAGVFRGNISPFVDGYEEKKPSVSSPSFMTCALPHQYLPVCRRMRVRTRPGPAVADKYAQLRKIQ
jgi:hypothetical protein